MSITLTFFRCDEAQLSELEKLDVWNQIEFFYSPLAQAQSLEIEKEWEILDFALCGETMPMSEPDEDGKDVPLSQNANSLHAVVYGRESTNLEASYGYRRLLRAEGVREIAALLESVEQATLRAHFETAQSLDLYAQHAENAAENWEILRGVFADVKAFFALAARENQLILTTFL